MPFKSKFHCKIPTTDILSYLFPYGEDISDEPLWRDADDPSITLSPKEAIRTVARFALGVKKLGISKGDVVLVISPNHIKMPLAYLCCIGSGAIYSAVNPDYTPREISRQIKDTSSSIILVHPFCLQVAIEGAQMAGLAKENLYLFHGNEYLKEQDSVKDWTSILASSEEARGWTWEKITTFEEASKTIVAINYSSGTTGLPKGVCQTHGAILANVAQVIYMKAVGTANMSPRIHDERWLGFLPLYHVYGILYTMLIAVKLKVPIFVVQKFDFLKLLSYIERYRITHLHAVPPLLVVLAKHPDVGLYDLTSVKQVLCGSAALSMKLQNKISKILGGGECEVKQGWGMTEAVCAATHVPGGEKDSSGSVGFLLPEMEAKLLDDNDEEVGPGERGEVLIRGPNIMLGYWRNPEATAIAKDRDGWLRTGDIAIVNDEHQFWIVDRKKELIKVKGFQVAPAELEAELLEYEDIADAGVASINKNGFEYPRAYVVKHPNASTTENEICLWIQSRVARYKWLAGGVCFVDEVPKSRAGKIQRQVLRSWADQEAKSVTGSAKL